MLTMKPIKDTAEIKSLCNKFSFLYSENILAYMADNGQECIGAGFFIIDSGVVDIKSIILTDDKDKLLGDGIKRAILNFGALEGAYSYITNSGNEESIIEFFSQGCKGSN